MLEMEQQQQQNPKKWSVREIITMFQSRFGDRIQSPSSSSSTLTLSLPLSNYRDNFDQNSFTLRRLSTTTMNNNRFLHDNNNNNNDDDRQQFKRNQKNQMSKESGK